MNLKELSKEIAKQEELIRLGENGSGKERQKRLGRLTARERLAKLLDQGCYFFEIGLWAGYEMYQEWGGLPAAGVIAGIGKVSHHYCMVIANDATVKAGAFFPQSVKKVLRAQRIAYECRLPILYLVDSSGVFLPLQDEIFPDEDDFGRIFRNNAVLSAEGIPQFAAIMGNCIAGGGYLPVLCDQVLMTKGSGLYLAGPALVKAAIGQVIDAEQLGGLELHSKISGTVDYEEEDDESCLKQLRKLVEMLPVDPKEPYGKNAKLKSDQLYALFDSREYDVRQLLTALVDEDTFVEYKKEYGRTLVTGFATLGGLSIGIVANQRLHSLTGKGELEIGGVVYSESADKAARFVLECNQLKLPLLFIQDVMGFMVGKEAEAGGIIRSGAKLVNAVSNSIVPKITLIVGSSFGAGNYALCGKAYDPNFIVAWPSAKYAVMGAEQAMETLFAVRSKAAERRGEKLSKDSFEKVKNDYEKQMDIRYAAARGWVDAIITPEKTREILKQLFILATRREIDKKRFYSGVIQT